LCSVRTSITTRDGYSSRKRRSPRGEFAFPDTTTRAWIPKTPVDRQIIGVVEDTARQSVTDTPEPEMFYLADKAPVRTDQMSLVVRTDGDPRAMIAAVWSAAQVPPRTLPSRES
jgi:hypothetical protein